MKKDSSHQWISIADLMSGVLAVVLLLLIVSILQNAVNQYNQEQEKLHGGANGIYKRQMINEVLNSVKSIAEKNDVDNLFKIDAGNSKFVLADGTFSRGSACITPEMKDALSKIADQLALFLSKNEHNFIYIEGHTDNVSVSQPVTDFYKYCTVYDDNYTLSASRAREARNILVKNVDGVGKNRFIVAGYGDSKPVNKDDMADAANRRVEIRLVNDSL